MAEERRGRKPPERDVMGTLEFVGLGDQPTPELRMEAIDPEGKRTEIRISERGEFELARALAGKGYALEIRASEGGSPRRFSYDAFLDRIEKERTYRLPEALWKEWLFFQTCVTGSVVSCHPIFTLPESISIVLKEAGLPESAFSPSAILPELDLGFQIPHVCRPVCQGKVEVFVRTCCCPPIGPLDPPIIIADICKIIDCDPIPWPPGPWPIPPEPLPPLPPPGPGPDPELQRAMVRALKRSTAVESAAEPAQVLRLTQHVSQLRRLPLAEQVRYIEAHAELRFWRCTCSTIKVAEVPLQADGHFDACFQLSPWLLPGCTRRVMYRVSQLQGDSWVTIYDGPARGESFALNEPAELKAGSGALPCDHPEFPAGTPFVILEQIGNTWADTLIHSTGQNGETSFGGPLAATDGLANPPPAGPIPITAGPYNQPWGTTLNLRYQLHPGLQALGAKYYRTRIIRVGNNGQPLPGGPNFTLTGNVSWRKYYPQPGGGVGVQWVPLNNPVINGQEGLYTIPFPDLVWPWLGGQWHAFVATDELVAGVPRMPNGPYLFVVDIFNAAGQRMVSNGSLEPPAAGDVSAAFEYRRLDGPIDAAFSNTSVVPYNALANLF